MKPVESCSVCHEAFGHIRSDDAAPWLTILIVGHIAGPVILAFESDRTWPDWVSMALWPAFALVLALLVLPRAKALFIGAIWATKAPGSEQP
ncbi:MULTISPECIES: DUF983 domain-containing protein [Limibacillus]|uniref:DUF983 domain-containing protein n=1 Tax=Limibacillus TaxID=1848396 RepID=UPI001C847EA7|nr:DUF983 domain-containing protein [Limibacillus halophilus]